MNIGVPQRGGRDDVTNRVKMLIFYADNAADEIVLTRLNKAMDSQQARSLVILYWTEPKLTC